MEIISTSSAAVCAMFFVAGEPGPVSKVSSDMPRTRVRTSDADRRFATVAAPTILLLTDIDSASYVLKRPALITLRESDGEYILSFPDAEILTSGDTADEALSWMKDSIVTIYKTLKSERALGPLPKRQLKALENYLGPKSTSKA
jgi:predicted RNase H-like HicB family nuclease